MKEHSHDDLYELTRALSAGALDKAAFLHRLENWKPHRLHSLLTQFGFSAADLPADAANRVRLAAVTVAPEALAQERVAGPATTHGILHGQLFEVDPFSLKLRFIKPADDRKGDVAVMGVHETPDGSLEIRHDLQLCAADLPKHFDPPWERDEPVPETPPEEESPLIDEPVTASQYLHVNVKLVLAIPYSPNSLPTLSRILPYWKGQMKFSEEYAMKALLATGNPPPPDTFPTKKSFTDFIDSKEFRGVLDADLFVCCDNGKIGRVIADPEYIIGYTPPLSDIDPEPAETLRARLGRDHDSRENLSSQITRAIQDGGVLSKQIAALGGFPIELGLDDQIDDAIPHLITNANSSKINAKTPESHARGNLKKGPETAAREGDCFNGSLKMGIQVNNIENILFYMLTGRLLPYMWGQLQFKLCCDGSLQLFVKGSAIPNKTLYVNNRKVDAYDMTSVSFDKIKVSVPLAPKDGSNDKKRLPDPSQLDFAPAPEEIQATSARTLRHKPGCPRKVPDAWLFDGV